MYISARTDRFALSTIPLTSDVSQNVTRGKVSERPHFFGSCPSTGLIVRYLWGITKNTVSLLVHRFFFQAYQILVKCVVATVLVRLTPTGY
jgi:hypothetical protein